MSSGRESLSVTVSAPDRSAAIDRCRRALADEGFRVSGSGPSDLVAHRGARAVRALRAP